MARWFAKPRHPSQEVVLSHASLYRRSDALHAPFLSKAEAHMRFSVFRNLQRARRESARGFPPQTRHPQDLDWLVRTPLLYAWHRSAHHLFPSFPLARSRYRPDWPIVRSAMCTWSKCLVSCNVSQAPARRGGSFRSKGLDFFRA